MFSFASLEKFDVKIFLRNVQKDKKYLNLFGNMSPFTISQQLSAKPQFYLTSYRYIGFQNYSLNR
jgi:hypothetical protein